MLLASNYIYQNIPYSVRLSRRATRMRLAVYCDSSVVLTMPTGFDMILAEKFLKQKFAWVAAALKKFQPFTHRYVIKSNRWEYKKYRQAALQLAILKVKELNKFYGFSFNRVSVKNQKTRWGSCSKKGNLNFNYKIIHLPQDQLNYLIVHELCHLKEFNHSKNFWALVAKTVPEYKKLRMELKNFNKVRA